MINSNTIIQSKGLIFFNVVEDGWIQVIAEFFLLIFVERNSVGLGR